MGSKEEVGSVWAELTIKGSRRRYFKRREPDLSVPEGSPRTLKILVWIVAVTAIWSVVQAAPVVAATLTQASVAKSFDGLDLAQSHAYYDDGKFAGNIKTLLKHAKENPIEFGLAAKVEATCELGYLMSITTPFGEKVYRSSEGQRTGELETLRMPECIVAESLDDEQQIPGPVSGVTVVRSEVAGGTLKEGALVSWEAITEPCTELQVPAYRVRTTNIHPWGPPSLQTFVTQNLSLDVPNIHNGADYSIGVSAQCNDWDSYGEETMFGFSQTVGATDRLRFLWNWREGGWITMSWSDVSSSRWGQYEIEWSRNGGNAWNPLMATIKENSMVISTDNYAYRSGDDFRVRALSDTGTPTEWAYGEIERVR